MSRAEKRSDGGNSVVRSAIGWGVAVWEKLSAIPFVAHVVRAIERFNNRMGNQFASAITYFSFLAMVPIVMVGFAIVGYILASRPDLLNSIVDSLLRQVPELSDILKPVIDTAVNQRLTVGIVGLVVALYSGVGWMGNIRKAVQAQTRPSWDVMVERKLNMFVAMPRNLLALAGLGAGVLLSIAVTTFGGQAQSVILNAMGVTDDRLVGPVIRIGSLILALLANWCIFLWVYAVLPGWGEVRPRNAILIGSAAAAVAFEVLKYALTLILPMVTGSLNGAVFGSIIGLFFFFNITATIVLMIAAWIATSLDPLPPDLVEVLPAPVTVSVRRGAPAGVLLGLGTVVGWLAARLRRR